MTQDPDPVLVGLATLANKGSLTISISLFVHGNKIEGLLTSQARWRESFSNEIKESALVEGMVVAASANSSAYLHVISPKVSFGAEDSVMYTTSPPLVLRVAINAVSAWHLGTPTGV